MYKFLSEIGPLFAFFVGYKYGGGIKGATLYMIITSFVTISLCYFAEGKIHPFSLASSIILAIAGGLTLVSGNALFIKIKATILYFLSSLFLTISAWLNRPVMRHVFEKDIKLKDAAWKVLHYRFASFFVFMGILNELIWRNFSDDFWVQFKVFGAVPLMLFFSILQVPYMMDNKEPENDETQTQE